MSAREGGAAGPTTASRDPVELDDEALRRWALPLPDAGGDKEERGRVLLVGGSREIAGAVVLAGVAALRAGAGKLAIATAAGVASSVALAVPEARVLGLPETEAGGLSLEGLGALAKVAERADAVLVGPGMQDEQATAGLVEALLPRLAKASLLLDAAAMGVVRAGATRFDAPVLMTPHAGEMAHLTGLDKEGVQDDPLATARGAAGRWNAVLALKGATTYIVRPDGRAWCNRRGSIGLGTSGSGDTLAGIMVGLLARGASLEQAAAWGVALHARAGERLAERLGPLGFLAREVPGEVPALMRMLGDLDVTLR